MRIQSLKLTRLNNHGHLHFFNEVAGLWNMVGIGTDKAEMADLYKPFMMALDNEVQASKIIQGSAVTKLVDDMDQQRDELYHGLDLTVEANLFHYEPANREAARRIMRILEQDGDPRKLTYKYESEALVKIIALLETSLSADAAKIGLTGWVSALKKMNKEFDQMVTDRHIELSERPAINMKDARLQTEQVYQKLIERINALIVLKGEAPYASFVTKLNTLISSYRNTVAMAEGRAEKAQAKSAQA